VAKPSRPATCGQTVTSAPCRSTGWQYWQRANSVPHNSITSSRTRRQCWQTVPPRRADVGLRGPGSRCRGGGALPECSAAVAWEPRFAACATAIQATELLAAKRLIFWVSTCRHALCFSLLLRSRGSKVLPGGLAEGKEQHDENLRR
jgi:hypothetical protein